MPASSSIEADWTAAAAAESARSCAASLPGSTRSRVTRSPKRLMKVAVGPTRPSTAAGKGGSRSNLDDASPLRNTCSPAHPHATVHAAPHWSPGGRTVNCGTPMTHRGPLTDAHDRLAAELADDYLIEEELGRGASATVFLAQDLRHGRRVALKVLHSALGQALGVERFLREIRTQARLHHPHILPVFDSGSAAGQLYYVMPHVETGTLKDRLRRQGPQSVAAAVQVGQEVASALSYANALGVIHRDLKPDNIVFSPMGHAILADFGIAVAADSGSAPRLTETGVAVGTPVYMSPEQSAGDEVLDGRSDQYSLAAVIYESLAGVPPFTGPNARAIFAQKLTETPPPIGRVDVPEAVERALLRALERAREARYESIDAFAAALAA